MDEILKAIQDNAPALIATSLGTAVVALWSREFIQRLFVILWARLSRKTKSKLDDEILAAAKAAYNIEEKK